MQDTNNPQATPTNPMRRRFIRTSAGGVILAATGAPILKGCSYMATVPDSATSAWNPNEEETDLVRWALSYAILAPNPHNLQPWLVDLSNEEEILVSLDPNRLLPATDPFNRQIMIGTGAMLGIFELAMASRGYVTQTEWIGNTKNNPSNTPLNVSAPLLKVRFEKASVSSVAAEALPLFEQITRRHTNRSNYDPTKRPSSDFASSLAQYAAENQSIGLIDNVDQGDSFEKISNWTKQAWEIELITPEAAMESIRLLRIGRKEIDRHRDGIVINSPLLSTLNSLGMFDRSKPLDPASSNFQRQISQFNDSIDSTPSWFYLTSTGNSRMDQIESGKAFVKAQLRATELGMVMHPISQALQEYSEMQTIYSDITQHMESITNSDGITVQMLARIGYLPDASTASKPAPRRGLDAHIIG